MTKQEQAAAKLQQAQAALKRTELEGKLVAAEAVIEKAEKSLAEAKDEAGRKAAQGEIDLAKAAKRAIVEALITHDDLQEKEARIELVLNGGSSCRSGSYVGRVFDGFKALAGSVF
jgi:membrane protein involved in colicin uptake